MKNTKVNSNKQEKKVAKEIKGNTVVASGALWHSKSDVRNASFLCECKTTQKDFYSLKTSVWDKIENEALRDGIRIPLMCIDLESGKDRIAIININDFIGLNLDTYNYVGVSDPITVDNLSYRVTGDFLDEDIPLDVLSGEIVYFRKDIKFVGEYRKHLVMISWYDFMTMLKEQDNSNLEVD